MSLPLEGLKVLDLTRLLPGGFCSMLLADFGADVIKVEDTGLGDYVRWAPPYYEGVERSAGSALASSAVEANTCARRDVLPPPCAGASPSGSYSEVPDNVGLLTPDVTPHPRCIRVSAKGHAAGR